MYYSNTVQYKYPEQFSLALAILRNPIIKETNENFCLQSEKTAYFEKNVY